jgi:hypothetical protein
MGRDARVVPEGKEAVNTCQCGEPATLLARVLKAEDADHAEATFACCKLHVADALLALEPERQKVQGIVTVVADRKDPYELAWWLIKQTPWHLHAPEILILLALAAEHAAGRQWVSDAGLALRRQCSEQNARESINRPRINDTTVGEGTGRPLVVHREMEGQDGKKRVYHRLNWWEP